MAIYEGQAEAVPMLIWLDNKLWMQSGNGVAAHAASVDKPFPWAVGFFSGNTEVSLERDDYCRDIRV